MILTILLSTDIQRERNMVLEIKVMLDKHKRGKAEPLALAQQLETRGSQVLEWRQISRIVPNPFPGLRLYPILYEIKASHGQRRGTWFVRTGDDGNPPDWLWSDDHGYDTSPLPELGPAASTQLQPISWGYDSVLIGGSILIGVPLVIYIALDFL
jgi:hypothetical protein